MNRTAASGYQKQNSDSEAAAPGDISERADARAGHIEADAREELGFGSRPLSNEQRQALTERIQLKRAEDRLATKREKKQYYAIRTALKNDRERLYFLGLPTFASRERWAGARGLNGQEVRSEEITRAIEAKDIALGMSQKSVLESWGDPDSIEAAGNRLYGYERWRYNRYLSGNEGYEKQMRVVYFEGGYVVGWERP